MTATSISLEQIVIDRTFTPSPGVPSFSESPTLLSRIRNCWSNHCRPFLYPMTGVSLCSWLAGNNLGMGFSAELQSQMGVHIVGGAVSLGLLMVPALCFASWAYQSSPSKTLSSLKLCSIAMASATATWLGFSSAAHYGNC